MNTDSDINIVTKEKNIVLKIKDIMNHLKKALKDVYLDTKYFVNLRKQNGRLINFSIDEYQRYM